MVTRTMSGTAAWTAAAKGPATRWSDHIARLTDDVVTVAHRPKFAISRDARFFCIGSCFARNIEEHLIYHDIAVLSRRIVSPHGEWPARANGFVNKFTTHSIRNELDWALVPPPVDARAFQQQQDGWLDLQLSPRMPPVPLERAIARRRYLNTDYFARVRTADIVVLTLGLNEIWFDARAGRHLNAAPSFTATRREPDRYALHLTDVADNLAALEGARAAILALNPAARIVVTVSPVPMSETFSGADVLVANMRSKSTLRAAAAEFADAHDDVDHFPSYDIVSMSPRAQAYEADCLHVADSVVGAVMRSFLRAYLGLDGAAPAFDERAYLAAHPDVDAAVRRGELASGFEHWRAMAAA